MHALGLWVTAERATSAPSRTGAKKAGRGGEGRRREGKGLGVTYCIFVYIMQNRKRSNCGGCTIFSKMLYVSSFYKTTIVDRDVDIFAFKLQILQLVIRIKIK